MHENTQMSWEHFHHEADIGVRGTGDTLEQAFEQAALALTAVVTDPDSVNASRNIELECKEPDFELLFVDWLNRIIFEMVTGNMLFKRFKVRFDNGKLTAVLTGEEIDRRRHELAVEPKGATYTELKVLQQNDGTWLAQCVIDV